MKPIILTTAYKNPCDGDNTYKVVDTYIEAVRRAGGMPLVIPVTEDIEEIDRAINLSDGLLLPGGEDMDMLLFGEEPHANVNLVLRNRDMFELELFKRARATNKPILGVCRGMQLIALATGGTIYQDLNTQVANACCHKQNENTRGEYIHSVLIEKSSKIFEIFGEENIFVNSFHHQAVKTVVGDMKISANAKDGIIEAIESADGMVIGVQWHPESLSVKYPHHLKIFEYFIELSKK